VSINLYSQGAAIGKQEKPAEVDLRSLPEEQRARMAMAEAEAIYKKYGLRIHSVSHYS
jgi:hypothetical protein